MNARSLRFRLIVWYAGWLSVVFIAFGGIIYFASKQYLESTLKETLLRRARQIAEVVQDTETKPKANPLPAEIQTRFAPEANSRFVRITRATGDEIYESGPPKDSSFDPRTIPASEKIDHRESLVREVLAGGQPMFFASVPVATARNHYIVEVGSSAVSIKMALHHVLVAFGIAVPMLIAVAVAGGYLLVQRALEPVDQVIRTAERISSDNLGERLPVPATGDELERLSTALNNMIRRLDESFQHNTRFMADTSHELRTPLTVMRAELEETLRNHAGNLEEFRLAETMLEEVQRLARIVASLFAMSRFDDKEAMQEFARFDLGTLVTSTADQMSALAEDKHLTIRCTIARPVLVDADRPGLKQVTVNLLDNAIKYTPSGGSITVNVHARDSKAVLEVADTGMGIPPDALPLVFDRFFRVDKALSRELGGAGLGLSIVKAICAAHGGTVGVQSIQGEGSRFIVELPLASGTNGQSS